MRLAYLGFVLLAGCQLYFTDGDDEPPPDICENRPPTQPQVVARLIDPDTLACETFSQPTCDWECGPCPAATEAAGAIYIPPWGTCDSPCVGLSESACMANDACRVARDRERYYTQLGGDDFMGCYPIGTQPAAVDACPGLDAEQCGQRAHCTALYDDYSGQCLTPEQCIGAQFRECVDERIVDPGTCDLAACRQVPPTCSPGTRPGVENACYTGACIPDDYCVVSAF